MIQTPSQREYWRKNLWLTGSLLAIWLTITFGGGYFAAQLNTLTFLGFPLGFYLFAQGALIAFLVIIGIHVRGMQRLDARYLEQTGRMAAGTRELRTNDREGD